MLTEPPSKGISSDFDDVISPVASNLGMDLSFEEFSDAPTPNACRKRKYCPSCSGSEKPVSLRLRQINNEEAIYLCNQEKCLYPLLENDLQSFVIRRSFEELVASYNRKKRRRLSSEVGSFTDPKTLKSPSRITNAKRLTTLPFEYPRQYDINKNTNNLTCTQSPSHEEKNNNMANALVSTKPKESKNNDQMDLSGDSLDTSLTNMDISEPINSPKDTLNNEMAQNIVQNKQLSSVDTLLVKTDNLTLKNNDTSSVLPPISSFLVNRQPSTDNTLNTAINTISADLELPSTLINTDNKLSDAVPENLDKIETINLTEEPCPEENVTLLTEIKHCQLPTTVDTSTALLQWPNKNNSCWLDVILMCLATSTNIRKSLNRNLCNEKDRNGNIIHGLCQVFDNCHVEKTNTDIQSTLCSSRKVILQLLHDRFKIESGIHESAMEMFPNILKLQPSIKSLFTLQFRWEFECDECEYKQTRRYKNELVSFPSTSPHFHPLAASFTRTCFKCSAENQNMTMIMEKVPPCLLIHFQCGLPHSNLKVLSFGMQGHLYSISAVIQYINKPFNHFVAWIKNSKTNKWACCDGLKSDRCKWVKKYPKIPAEQVHIVMWEKQNGDLEYVSNDDAFGSSYESEISDDDMTCEEVIDLEASPLNPNSSDVPDEDQLPVCEENQTKENSLKDNLPQKEVVNLETLSPKNTDIDSGAVNYNEIALKKSSTNKNDSNNEKTDKSDPKSNQNLYQTNLSDVNNIIKDSDCDQNNFKNSLSGNETSNSLVEYQYNDTTQIDNYKQNISTILPNDNISVINNNDINNSSHIVDSNLDNNVYKQHSNDNLDSSISPTEQLDFSEVVSTNKIEETISNNHVAQISAQSPSAIHINNQVADLKNQEPINEKSKPELIQPNNKEVILNSNIVNQAPLDVQALEQAAAQQTDKPTKISDEKNNKQTNSVPLKETTIETISTTLPVLNLQPNVDPQKLKDVVLEQSSGHKLTIPLPPSEVPNCDNKDANSSLEANTPDKQKIVQSPEIKNIRDSIEELYQEKDDLNSSINEPEPSTFFERTSSFKDYSQIKSSKQKSNIIPQHKEPLAEKTKQNNNANKIKDVSVKSQNAENEDLTIPNIAGTHPKFISDGLAIAFPSGKFHTPRPLVFLQKPTNTQAPIESISNAPTPSQYLSERKPGLPEPSVLWNPMQHAMTFNSNLVSNDPLRLQFVAKSESKFESYKPKRRFKLVGYQKASRKRTESIKQTPYKTEPGYTVKENSINKPFRAFPVPENLDKNSEYSDDISNEVDRLSAYSDGSVTTGSVGSIISDPSSYSEYSINNKNQFSTPFLTPNGSVMGSPARDISPKNAYTTDIYAGKSIDDMIDNFDSVLEDDTFFNGTVQNDFFADDNSILDNLDPLSFLDI